MRLGAACLLALAPSAAAQTDDTEVRSFALPDTRAARGLVAAIEGHIAAERMEEAAAQSVASQRLHSEPESWRNPSDSLSLQEQRPTQLFPMSSKKQFLRELSTLDKKLWTNR